MFIIIIFILIKQSIDIYHLLYSAIHAHAISHINSNIMANHVRSLVRCIMQTRGVGVYNAILNSIKQSIRIPRLIGSDITLRINSRLSLLSYCRILQITFSRSKASVLILQLGILRLLFVSASFQSCQLLHCSIIGLHISSIIIQQLIL